MDHIRLQKEQIRKLEEKLLDPQIRKSGQDLSNLLADEFLEIGSSGRTYNKSDVINALSAECPGNMQISEFHMKLLSPDIALATYRILQTNKETGSLRHFLHSSIWKRNDGGWQLLFHQGTPTSP